MTDQTPPPPGDPQPPAFEPPAADTADTSPQTGDTLTNKDSPPPFVTPSATRPPSPRRLYRSRNDRKVGGVAGGIAEFLGIDPTIVRVATLLLAFTGVAIVVYIAMWLIVPEAPDGVGGPPGPGLLAGERNMNVALGVAAIALAVGILSGSWALLAFALIGGGVWLLSEQTSASDGQGSAVDYGSQPFGSAPGAEPVTTPTPVVSRPRQKISGITLSLVAMLVGVSIAAEAGGWWHVSAPQVLGLVIVVIGGGVVAGVIRGSSVKGLVAIGVLAALALVPVAALDGLVGDGVGETLHRPQGFEDLRSSYRLGVGSLTVDLSQLDFEGRSERVDVDLGMGEVIVIVPRDVGGTAELDAGAGEVSFEPSRTFGSGAANDGVSVSVGPRSLDGTRGTLELDVHVGLGSATIRFAGDE